MLPVFNTVRFFLGLRCVRGSCIVKGPMGSKANWFLFCFPVSGTKDGGSYDLHRYSHFILNSFFPVTAWPVISARFCFLPSRTECRLWCMCVVTPSSFPSSPWLQTHPASKSTQLPPHTRCPSEHFLSALHALPVCLLSDALKQGMLERENGDGFPVFCFHNWVERLHGTEKFCFFHSRILLIIKKKKRLRENLRTLWSRSQRKQRISLWEVID